MVGVEDVVLSPPELHDDAGSVVSWNLEPEALRFIDRTVLPGSRTLEVGIGASTVVPAAKGCDHTVIGRAGGPGVTMKVALDVGGVIYFDEPFDVAWVQEVFDAARAEDGSFTLDRLRADLRGFHRAEGGGAFRAPLAHRAWLRVRDRWTDLVQPIPGSVEAVAALAERHVVCVVANQPEECLRALDGLGLTGLFAEIALDSLVGYAKPDPALLAHACAGLGWDPADVLVVGNRVDHDVVPALALGCPVAFVLAHGGWAVPDRVHPDVAAVHREVRPVRPALSAHLEAKVGYVTADLAGLAAVLTGDAGAER